MRFAVSSGSTRGAWCTCLASETVSVCSLSVSHFPLPKALSLSLSCSSLSLARYAHSPFQSSLSALTFRLFLVPPFTPSASLLSFSSYCEDLLAYFTNAGSIWTAIAQTLKSVSIPGSRYREREVSVLGLSPPRRGNVGRMVTATLF